MKLLIKFSTIILLLCFIISCLKDETPIEDPIIKPAKSYLDFADFIDEGLIAYYPFNGDVNDYSGNNFHGENIGVMSSEGRFGGDNGSFLFSGVNYYIRIPNNPLFNSDTLTICFWINNKEIDDNYERVIFSKADINKYGFILKMKGPHMQLEMKYESRVSDIGGYFHDKNQFFFVAFSITQNEHKLYINGEPVSEGHITHPRIFKDINQYFYIGKSLYTGYDTFKGSIDDLLIYNRMLTELEVYKLYKLEED